MKNNIFLIIGINMAILTFDTGIAIADSNSNFKIDDPSSDRDRASFGSILQISDRALNSQDQEETVLPRESSTDSLDLLNPNADPLISPTQANEVEINISKPITLEQALQLSLQNNKDIVEARIEIERSRFALRQEKAALFPSLNLSSSFNSPSVLGYKNSGFLDSVAEQQADAGISAGGAGNSAESFTFSPNLGLRYDIYDGGLRGASIRVAQKQLRSIELALVAAIDETRLETAINYYALQDGDASIEIAEANVRDATRTLRDAQLNEEAGVGTRFDVLRARVELSEAQQSLISTIAERDIARRELAETLSIAENASLSAADRIKKAGTWSLSLSESIVGAYKNRAELKQFLLQREIAEEQRTIALSQIRPTISTAANYGLSDDFEDDLDIIDEYSLALNIQWELFDGGAARAGERQAEKDIEIAETQFANQRNEIRLAVEQAYLNLTANQSNITSAAEEVKLAEESLQMARLRFQEGIGTQTDVIDAQTQLTTSRSRLLSSITTYNQSLADLRRQVSNTGDVGL